MNGFLFACSLLGIVSLLLNGALCLLLLWDIEDHEGLRARLLWGLGTAVCLGAWWVMFRIPMTWLWHTITGT